jgi:hypothetical protein
LINEWLNANFSCNLSWLAHLDIWLGASETFGGEMLAPLGHGAA